MLEGPKKSSENPAAAQVKIMDQIRENRIETFRLKEACNFLLDEYEENGELSEDATKEFFDMSLQIKKLEEGFLELESKLEENDIEIERTANQN